MEIFGFDNSKKELGPWPRKKRSGELNISVLDHDKSSLLKKGCLGPQRDRFGLKVVLNPDFKVMGANSACLSGCGGS